VHEMSPFNVKPVSVGAGRVVVYWLDTLDDRNHEPTPDIRQAWRRTADGVVDEDLGHSLRCVARGGRFEGSPIQHATSSRDYPIGSLHTVACNDKRTTVDSAASASARSRVARLHAARHNDYSPRRA
jgi:hypothetical protein